MSTIIIQEDGMTIRIDTATPIGVINEGTLDPANQTSGSATAGQVPVADGAGGITWSDNVLDRVGWVRIENVLAQNVGDTITGQVYDDPPGNTILQSATSSSPDITLVIASSFPNVRIDLTDYVLPLISSEGLYRDSIDLTLAAAGDVTVASTDTDGNPGASDTVTMAIDLPPVISAATFTGGYPGSQTEVKQADYFSLEVTADKSFNEVIIADYGAGQATSTPVAAGLSATIAVTIADRGDIAQLLGARVSVLDTLTGAESATYDTDSAGSVNGYHVVNCNNLAPTVTWGAPTYPTGGFGLQQALKGVEAATVPITLADLDTVAFDDISSGELTVTNPTTIETPKTVTRAGGTYNITVDNLRAVANRAANDSTTVDVRNVGIANTPTTIQVTLPAARLRSGGQDGTTAPVHTITLACDQNLLSTPTIDPDAGFGTLTGGWTGGPSTYTNGLQLDDFESKGVATWQTPSAINLAGIETTTISVGSTYVSGGFVPRTLTFAAYATTASMSAQVVDFAKLQAGIFTATNNAAIKQAIGTPPSVTDGFTVNSLAVIPTNVIWLDSPAALGNSTGTATITDVEEVA